jgi:hypothetical protein
MAKLSQKISLTSKQIKSFVHYSNRCIRSRYIKQLKKNCVLKEKLNKFKKVQLLMEKCANRLVKKLNIQVDLNPMSKLPRLFHILLKMHHEVLEELVDIRKELDMEKEKNLLKLEQEKKIK